MWQKGSTFLAIVSAAFLPHELNANVYLFIYLYIVLYCIDIIVILA
jgi:hypothetical protein